VDADHPYFQTGVTVDRCHQGDETIGREVNVLNTIAWHGQNIREDQVDRLAVREQMLKVIVRQGGEQTICRGTRFSKRQWNSPVVPRPTGGTRRVWRTVPMSDS
jgi:hypothetical protein